MVQGRIHSVELLEMALAAAAQLGYRIRDDQLGGLPGGACQLKGQKWLLLDPSISVRERLELVIQALAADSDALAMEVPGPLAHALQHACAMNKRAAG
jgi:hypothetical protein